MKKLKSHPYIFLKFAISLFLHELMLGSKKFHNCKLDISVSGSKNIVDMLKSTNHDKLYMASYKYKSKHGLCNLLFSAKAVG